MNDARLTVRKRVLTTNLSDGWGVHEIVQNGQYVVAAYLLTYSDQWPGADEPLSAVPANIAEHLIGPESLGIAAATQEASESER